jgi:hypothetical protein
MVDKVRFEKDAIKELNIAKCYFDSLDKGNLFINDFENQVSLITTMPEAFQIRYKQVRIISFSDFSYTIHYVFENNIIVIFNILNQYQDY